MIRANYKACFIEVDSFLIKAFHCHKRMPEQNELEQLCKNLDFDFNSSLTNHLFIKHGKSLLNEPGYRKIA